MLFYNNLNLYVNVNNFKTINVVWDDECGLQKELPCI